MRDGADFASEEYSRLRRQGVRFGLAGLVMFFASVAVMVAVPLDLTVYPAVTMVVGIILLAVGYLRLRKADIFHLKE